MGQRTELRMILRAAKKGWLTPAEIPAQLTIVEQILNDETSGNRDKICCAEILIAIDALRDVLPAPAVVKLDAAQAAIRTKVSIAPSSPNRKRKPK